MSKETINLIYKFNGNIESIDIFEIAPILLSVGQIIQDANKIIYPDAEPIGVNAKPFEKGSFIIEIVLFAKNNFQNLLSFVNSNEEHRIKELLEFIGLIGGGTGTFAIGLIKLITWLKGKPPKKIEKINEHENKVTSQADCSITVNNNVIKLYSNTNIKNNISNAWVRALNQENVENIESYLKEDRDRTKASIDQGIKGYIQDYVLSHLIEDTTDKSIIEELYLSPKRGSFSGEANSWSFRRSTNNDIISVNIISDQDFLEKCKNGIIRPFEKDMLKVQLKTTFNLETMKPKKTEIIKVLEYIAYKDLQLKLDL